MSASNPKTTITANEKSDPFNLCPVASSVNFTLEGGTAGTVTAQYANKEGTKVDADYTSDPSPITISGNAGPFEIPFGLAKFVRFVAAGVTGIISIRFSRAKNDRGDLIDIGVDAPPQPQVTA